MCEIETGIPIPPISKVKNWRYPWKTMEVGEYFTIDVKSPWSTVNHANKRYAPKEFTGEWKRDVFYVSRIK